MAAHPTQGDPQAGQGVPVPQALRPGGFSAKGAWIWTLHRKEETRKISSTRILGWTLQEDVHQVGGGDGGTQNHLKVMTELDEAENEGPDSVRFYFHIVRVVLLRR